MKHTLIAFLAACGALWLSALFAAIILRLATRGDQFHAVTEA